MPHTLPSAHGLDIVAFDATTPFTNVYWESSEKTAADMSNTVAEVTVVWALPVISTPTETPSAVTPAIALSIVPESTRTPTEEARAATFETEVPWSSNSATPPP